MGGYFYHEIQNQFIQYSVDNVTETVFHSRKDNFSLLQCYFILKYPMDLGRLAIFCKERKQTALTSSFTVAQQSLNSSSNVFRKYNCLLASSQDFAYGLHDHLVF